MAFILRITFSGLCLFVPEPAGRGNVRGATGRMHVLMPGMFGHEHTTDRHVPLLSYDAGYLVQGGPTLGIPTMAQLTGLTLAPVAGQEARLALCAHIVDLKEITKRPVDPDHLGPDTKKKLVSRVTLGAGRITRVSPGACWEWRPGEFRPITNKVEWEIAGIEGDRLELVGEALGGGGAPKALGTLFPVDGRINLDVLHDTTGDLLPSAMAMDHSAPPMPGESPRHFSAYYGVFGGPVSVVLPRYWGDMSDAPPLENGCEVIPPDMGTKVWTCLVASASA
jgi:hypothetical protein